jgi:large subunit ribosomal protein L10
MDKSQKFQYVKDNRERIVNAPLVFVAGYEGSTVIETEEIRNKLRPLGLEIQIVKNTLLRRIVADTPLEGLSLHFKGMNAIIVSGEDPIATARAVRDALSDKGKIQIKAGYFEGDVLDAKSAAAIADLPSREDLLATLLRTVQEAPRRVMSVMQAPARDLLYLLKNFENKLADSGDSE